MEANKKAKDLFNKIYYDIDFDLVGMPNTKKMVAKQCVLIFINEIINELKMRNCTIKHWQEVKEEINKL